MGLLFARWLQGLAQRIMTPAGLRCKLLELTGCSCTVADKARHQQCPFFPQEGP